jgi:hypothetical protein
MENYLPKTMDFYLPKSMDFSLPFTPVFHFPSYQSIYVAPITKTAAYDGLQKLLEASPQLAMAYFLRKNYLEKFRNRY